MNAGIDAPEVAKFIQRHQRLAEIEFNEEEAEAVAEALVRAGAVGKHRKRVLNRLISIAGKLINAAELEQERTRLEQAVKLLREEEAQLNARIQRCKDQGEALS
jgi:hypothetical protein